MLALSPLLALVSALVVTQAAVVPRAGLIPKPPLPRLPAFKNLKPACGGCDASKATLKLPADAAAKNLTVSGKPVFVTVGTGVQLYNCSNGSWISNGAKATLFDVSCFAGDDKILSMLTKAGQSLAKNSPAAFAAAIEATARLPVKQIGTHFFIPTPGSTAAGAISPEFNFDTAHGGPMPIGAASNFIGAKVGAYDSPDGAAQVAWLKLNATPASGSLAESVFRVQTVAGQPSTKTCSGTEQTESAYSAQYWFFK